MEADAENRPARNSSVAFGALPGALEALRNWIDLQCRTLEGGTVRHAELSGLRSSLVCSSSSLQGRPLFEAVVRACEDYGQMRTERCLAFIYTTMRIPLVTYAASFLSRLGHVGDTEAAALDLISNLFTELAEAMLDGPDAPERRSLAAENVVAWLYQAVRNDVLDFARSGANRFETRPMISAEETVEQVLDRLGTHRELETVPHTVRLTEGAEAARAFLSAFELATSKLKPKHRNALHLREVENCSKEQIAERLDLTSQQVQDLLQYAREKRAELMMIRIRATPALEHLRGDDARVVSLLKRVRLGSVVRGLKAMEGPLRARAPS